MKGLWLGIVLLILFLMAAIHATQDVKTTPETTKPLSGP